MKNSYRLFSIKLQSNAALELFLIIQSELYKNKNNVIYTNRTKFREQIHSLKLIEYNLM